MRLIDFLARHPIFRIEEFTDYLHSRGSANPSTRDALLAHYRETGRIIHIRRGLYASVPLGTPIDNFQIDPYLLASKLTTDAILAYHTALELHGKAYTVYEQFTYLTKRSIRPFVFQGRTYRGVSHPRVLGRTEKENIYVETVDRLGLNVRVTSLERTMVDVLDRPNLSGSWEEIWRSLESIEFLDVDKVVDYAITLGNATTVAKVGFYLEQHKKVLILSDTFIKKLKAHRPKNPHYMNREDRSGGQFSREWNLIVPTEIQERVWEES
jgi:predicted transcriptional regulator of viral defense system